MRRTGVWSFDSEGVVQSDTLGPHFRFLITRLGLPRADLREHLQQQGASARFFCFWINESGNRMPDVPDDIREMADATGIEIDIDEYR
nr:DUF4279 domain-containing protein [Caballeronia catudaia]